MNRSYLPHILYFQIFAISLSQILQNYYLAQQYLVTPDWAAVHNEGYNNLPDINSLTVWSIIIYSTFWDPTLQTFMILITLIRENTHTFSGTDASAIAAIDDVVGVDECCLGGRGRRRPDASGVQEETGISQTKFAFLLPGNDIVFISYLCI
jgi:hypothetical protein